MTEEDEAIHPEGVGLPGAERGKGEVEGMAGHSLTGKNWISWYERMCCTVIIYFVHWCYNCHIRSSILSLTLLAFLSFTILTILFWDAKFCNVPFCTFLYKSNSLGSYELWHSDAHLWFPTSSLMFYLWKGSQIVDSRFRPVGEIFKCVFVSANFLHNEKYLGLSHWWHRFLSTVHSSCDEVFTQNIQNG